MSDSSPLIAEGFPPMPGRRKGLFRRFWNVLASPSARFPLLALIVIGFFSGILFWGGFHTAMESSNTLEFCISCHEMESTVYAEYKKTAHFSNRSGVRAVCSDCHVPKDWMHKVVRKVEATGEIYSSIMGTIDTPEKFEAKRLTLAMNVWTDMKASDSRECRNCHSLDGMSKKFQTDTAWRGHKSALKTGETCIDCHKGVAHRLPVMVTNATAAPNTPATPATPAAPSDQASK